MSLWKQWVKGFKEYIYANKDNQYTIPVNLDDMLIIVVANASAGNNDRNVTIKEIRDLIQNNLDDIDVHSVKADSITTNGLMVKGDAAATNMVVQDDVQAGSIKSRFVTLEENDLSEAADNTIGIKEGVVLVKIDGHSYKFVLEGS